MIVSCITKAYNRFVLAFLFSLFVYDLINFVCSESEFDPDTYKIPFVVVSSKALATHVHSLLQSHEGTVPLLR